jgi:hypothetical protein
MFSVMLMILGLLDETASTVVIEPLPSCTQWESPTREVKWVFCFCRTITTLDFCAGPVDARGRLLEVHHERRNGVPPLLYMHFVLIQQ